MAAVSVRRELQSVDAGLRVPGASFARAYSVFGVISCHRANAALVRATRYGRHFQSPAPHADGRLDTPLLIRSNNLDIHIILDEL
jgi:hypothetical protein